MNISWTRVCDCVLQLSVTSTSWPQRSTSSVLWCWHWASAALLCQLLPVGLCWVGVEGRAAPAGDCQWGGGRRKDTWKEIVLRRLCIFQGSRSKTRAGRYFTLLIICCAEAFQFDIASLIYFWFCYLCFSCHIQNTIAKDQCQVTSFNVFF